MFIFPVCPERLCCLYVMPAMLLACMYCLSCLLMSCLYVCPAVLCVLMAPFCIQLQYVCLAGLLPFPSALCPVSCTTYVLSASMACLPVYPVCLCVLLVFFLGAHIMPDWVFLFHVVHAGVPSLPDYRDFLCPPCCVSRCHRPLYLVYSTT